jgi:hypothetical protein
MIGMSCENCLNPNITVAAMNTKRTKNPVSAEKLAKRWGVGEQKAKLTLDVTTQKGVRHVKHPAERRFKTSQPHLQKSEDCKAPSIRIPSSSLRRAFVATSVLS